MSLKKQDIFEGRSYEEWLKDAAEIEAEIENVSLKENEADKERLRSRILMEIYRQEEGKRKKTAGYRKTLRYVAGFVVILMGIFGLSMTSQANRTFIVEKVQEIFSDDADVRVKNEEVTVASSAAEKEARDQIEQTLELAVPEFFYIPEGMKFISYEMYPEVGIAEMRYSYGDKVLTLHISSNDEKSVESKNIDGMIVDTVQVEKEQILIEILEMANELNDDKMYHAQWVYKNVYYWLSGVIGQEEFEKILKDMIY